MDSKLFVLPTEPNYYPKKPSSAARKAALADIIPEGQYYIGPAPDSRFPGWAAPLADGRLVTDYRPHCNRNIQAGKQFATHQWMVQNADEIIQVSRDRQSQVAGAFMSFDNTVVPPPKLIVECNPSGCGYKQTDLPYGIGTERQEPVPELFGTFNTEKVYVKQKLPPITREFEGGRNSLRGRGYTDIGTGPIGNVNTKFTYLRSS
jgi:hypothetical protein